MNQDRSLLVSVMSATIDISPSYEKAIRIAILSQVVIATISLLLLDGGRIARIVGAAMICHWLIAALIICRRPKSPSSFDVLLVRFVFFVALGVGIFALQIIGK